MNDTELDRLEAERREVEQRRARLEAQLDRLQSWRLFFHFLIVVGVLLRFLARRRRAL